MTSFLQAFLFSHSIVLRVTVENFFQKSLDCFGESYLCYPSKRVNVRNVNIGRRVGRKQNYRVARTTGEVRFRLKMSDLFGSRVTLVKEVLENR